jgi:hypothetical protein
MNPLLLPASNPSSIAAASLARPSGSPPSGARESRSRTGLDTRSQSFESLNDAALYPKDSDAVDSRMTRELHCRDPREEPFGAGYQEPAVGEIARGAPLSPTRTARAVLAGTGDCRDRGSHTVTGDWSPRRIRRGFTIQNAICWAGARCSRDPLHLGVEKTMRSLVVGGLPAAPFRVLDGELCPPARLQSPPPKLVLCSTPRR